MHLHAAFIMQFFLHADGSRIEARFFIKRYGFSAEEMYCKFNPGCTVLPGIFCNRTEQSRRNTLAPEFLRYREVMNVGILSFYHHRQMYAYAFYESIPHDFFFKECHENHFLSIFEEAFQNMLRVKEFTFLIDVGTLVYVQSMCFFLYFQYIAQIFPDCFSYAEILHSISLLPVRRFLPECS